MKLFYLFLLPIVLIAHGGEKHDEEEVTKKIEIIKEDIDIYSTINDKYLKNIKPIFEVKCFNCHSNQTKQYWYSNLPIVSSLIKKDIKDAKKHLDFSKDFPFISHDTPRNDLVSILKSFEKKTMPPFRYRIMHSESKISEGDIQKVKIWVEKSLDLLDSM